MKANGTPDLTALADRLGITIIEARLEHGQKGCYQHHARRIILRPGLSRHQHDSTLAHELGHAHHEDEPTGHDHWDAVQERRADEFAARLLIRTAAVEAAARLHGPHPAVIARELGVTRHLLCVWWHLHQTRKAA